MICLFRHHDRFEVYRVFNMLKDSGVPCFVKNELIQGAIGDIPPQDSEPEVWLLEQDWQAKAKQLIVDFNQEQRTLQTEHLDPWVCSSCQEDNESTFNICWNCGASR